MTQTKLNTRYNTELVGAFSAGLLMAATAFAQDNDNGGIFAVVVTLIACALLYFNQNRKA